MCLLMTRTDAVLALTQILWELGEFIYVFARVAAVWDAEAKVKVKVLQKALLEIMPFDHAKAVNRPVSHCELHTKSWTGKTA